MQAATSGPLVRFRCRKAAVALARVVICVALAVGAVTLAPRPSAAATYTSPQRIEADFQKGLRALSAGDAATAIRLFRAILAERPDLPRVRLELARAYFVAREWTRSRREFVAVLSGDVPESVKRNILKFLQAIDARRGFDWNLSIGFASSPEGARDYDTDIVMVDVFGVPLPFTIERQDDGDFGVRATGSAEYRMQIPGASNGGFRATAFGEGFFDVFEGNGSGADDYRLGARAGVRGAWPQTTASASPFTTARFYGGEHFEDRVGIEVAAEWRSASGFSVFATAVGGVVDDHLSDFRDGIFGRLRGGVTQSIGGRARIGTALAAEQFDADADFESYTTLRGEVFAHADLGFGLDTTARAYLLKQHYDARIPVLLERREEWEYGLDVAVVKSDVFLLDQFSPYVKAGYSRRTSSIDAFSYRELRFEIGFQKTF